MADMRAKIRFTKISLASFALSFFFVSLSFADTQSPTEPVDKSNYTLFNPVPDDQMRAFSPDRPTKSNSATTVDAGHFQYEADFANWTYDHDNSAGITTSNLVIGAPTLKIGLTENTDFELATMPINFAYAKDRATNARSNDFGFGDLYTRLKYNIIGNEGGMYALAITPYVKAPTASTPIGNAHWEGGAYAPLSINLPDNWGLNFQSEYDRLEKSDLSGTYSNYQNLVNVSHPVIWDSLTGFLEFWSDVSGDQGGQVEYTSDLSLAWLIKDNLQLDSGVNIGLNKAASDLQVYAGIAQRF
jgi:hypothetical protein